MKRKHFGAIANAGPSHVQSMCAIGSELQRLGHQFTLFGVESQVHRAAQLGISAHQLGSSDPTTAVAATVREKPHAFLGAFLQYMREMTAILCEDAPGAL